MSAATSWPGKSNAAGETHPALWHLCDVANVSQQVMRGSVLERFTPEIRSAVSMFAGIHDLGKISSTFKAQIEQRFSPSDKARHWRLSFSLFRYHDKLLEELVAGHRLVREIFYAAAAGHHGRPVNLRTDVSSGRELLSSVGEEALDHTAEAIKHVHSFFSEANLEGLSLQQAKSLSWLVSGLTVLSDWTGSNTDWFPFSSASIPVSDYQEKSKAQAKLGTVHAGLTAANVVTGLTTTDILKGSARPMQAATETIKVPDGPALAIIEDTTGAGKTEASLIMAYRMMRQGKGKGVFFALPTMATSNAMFERMRPMLGKLFDGEPSLSLAHGQAFLHDGFSEVVGNSGSSLSDAGCARWIADNRRLSLMANIGVGTIDQALLGVLPTRFNTLRLWAIANQILIVDEAHAYDPYMERELQTLLQFHASFGGSAILMTATLPKVMREKFERAYRLGLMQYSGQPAHEDELQDLVLSSAYPCISVISTTSSQSDAVPSAPAACRRVEIQRLKSEKEAISAIKGAAEKGAACLWVRNAVDDAISAYQQLQSEGLDVAILHARFAMGDRLTKEEEITQLFGPDRESRSGKVLVATQVVEASLDLDFDMMVSDLAPIGALVQRAGRLWRHMHLRPAETRPVPGPNLHVLSPDPENVQSASWLQGVLGGGAFVYRVDHQWRTASALFQSGEINLPDGLRDLIEAVHGDGAKDLPDVLLEKEGEALGRQFAEASMAQRNLLNPTKAYHEMEHAIDDENYPTRLGEATRTLVLVSRRSGRLEPLNVMPGIRRSIAMSELSLSVRRLKRLGLDEQIVHDGLSEFTKDWKGWEKREKRVLIVGEDGGITSNMRYDPAIGLILGAQSTV